MRKRLMKIGNSQGIILDKPILDLLKIKENTSFEVTHKDNGLFLKPISVSEAYKKVSKKHRSSLDKLAK